MQNLSHLIYASRSATDFPKDHILKLLSRARKKNSSLNVTGMLLYDSGSFFQVIEGDETVIANLFAEISSDARHSQVVKIISESIQKREFANWSMGYADMSQYDLKKTEGLNDFFDGSKCLSKLDNGRAKKVLKAFAEGRWRLA